MYLTVDFQSEHTINIAIQSTGVIQPQQAVLELLLTDFNQTRCWNADNRFRPICKADDGYIMHINI